MKEKYKNVPVLLIGLGGIGSEIVDSIYGRLKEEEMDENVEALVFDTDINSQRNLNNISAECKIQTSTDKTIKYGLDNDPSTRDWFPSCPDVNKKQMLNGAGQIRAVSRLALRSAMKEGKLNAVHAVRERLFRVGSGTDVKGLRVMIVSSMMGGTGSGMFLQIPLYIREVFESQITGGADRIEIQGTFILPDVLKGAISPEETENVYSNAYASMKELNAIITSLGGDGTNIDLEYKPDQVNENGIRDISIKDWPYDYCYFYDKEDTKGRVLSGFNDYIKMIEKNLYFQVFGPISDKMQSIYCNKIKEIASKGGRNIYGGVGVGELTYPYNDIVDFCTYKVLINNLDNQLLKLDHIYKMELARYHRNIQNGIDDIMPDKEDVYITNFDSLTTTDNFFMNIKRSFTEYDEDGKIVSNNIKKLHINIDENIKSIYENKFKDEINKCSVATNHFINLPVEQFRTKISYYEKLLRESRLMIEARARIEAEAKSNADFGVHSDSDKSILDDYLVNKERFINCVGIRYILYKLHKILKNKKIELDEILEKMSIDLKCLENAHFTKEDGNKANADDKFIDVSKNKGLFDKKLKNFREEYGAKVSKHYKLLENYANNNLKRYYYESSIKLLEGLLAEYENMFDSLLDRKTDVEKQINSLLIKHDDTKGTTNHYVLGDKKYKEQIWNTMPEEVKNSVLSNTLSEEMHKALFGSFQKKVNNSIGKKVSYDDLFHNLIVKSCRDKLLSNSNVTDELQINVIEALEREAEFNGAIEDKQEYIKERLAQLIDSVAPWAPKSTSSSDINLWGINPNCKTKIDSVNGKSMLEKLIEETSSSKLAAKNIVPSEVLDDKSIYFVTARYGLMVDDFTKFSAGKNNRPDGDYYVAYKNVIDRIINEGKLNSANGMTITPHIDKRWHLTLRDINDEIYERQMKDIAKAFILGITNRNFVIKQMDTNEDIRKFVSVFDGLPTIINHQGKSIDGNLKSLYKALYANPDLVKNVLDQFEKYCENAQRVSNRDNDILETDLINKLNNVFVYGYNDVKNIIDTFINFDRESTQSEKEDKKYIERYNNLYEALFEIVEIAVKPYCFGQGDYNFKLNCKKVLETLVTSSYWNTELDENDMVYASSIGVIKNKINNM